MNNEDVDNISRLKFIGKIQKGEKINIKYMFVQQNNLFTKINRSIYYCDNRQNTLSFLTETVKKSFEDLIQHIKNATTFDITIANNIVQDFDNCKSGLSNLKDTYNDDLMFCCKIDKIIQDINARLEEIKLNNNIIINNNNVSTKFIPIPNSNNKNTNYTNLATSPNTNLATSSNTNLATSPNTNLTTSSNTNLTTSSNTNLETSSNTNTCTNTNTNKNKSNKLSNN